MQRKPIFVLLPLAVAASLRAQCDPTWMASGSVPGSNAPIVDSALWDPDGPGPAAPQLVVVGSMELVADQRVFGVACRDTATGVWAPLGAAPGLPVSQVEVLVNGDLVIAEPGGVHRWDGVAWQPFGAGAMRLLALPDGRLLAARSAGNESTIEVWDGVTWSTFAPPIAGAVLAMATMPNGDLVAGGLFAAAGGVTANGVARWNGTTWAALGAGVAQSRDVRALAVLPSGDLVAGGYFAMAGNQSATRIARWDGAAWQPLGSGITGPIAYAAPHVATLRTLANGDLIVGGYFDHAGLVLANCVARWRNGTWSALGVGVDRTVQTIAELPGGELVFGGDLGRIETGAAAHLARWDGAVWSAFGAGALCDGSITASLTTSAGDLLVGGTFTTVDGIVAHGIARRSHGTWSPLGAGVDGAVLALVECADGSVIAGGAFETASGVVANHIARWNGSAWTPLGGGVDQVVHAVAELANGDIVAGGTFLHAGGQPANYVARWDGSSWSALGAGTVRRVTALAVLADGDLAIASSEVSPFWPGAELLRWNGAALTTIANVPFGNILALHTMPDGDLLVGGTGVVINSNGLTRWTGSTWIDQWVGTGTEVRAFEVLPDGDLIAAGRLQLGGATHRLARRDGTTWIPLDGADSRRLNTVAWLPEGELAVGGDFQVVGDVVSPFFATLAATCPASATPFGTGCAGSGGLDELTATALPWLGAALRTRASGYGPSTLVAVITGFTQVAVPLPALFAEGLPGCSAHNTGESIELALPTAGAVQTRIAVPNAVALIGASVHQYALAIEYDANGAVLAITSSNGLTATLGRY
ncbi:MAG: hypothetical protein R3F29_10085 [Planctomycetota bacterium]